MSNHFEIADAILFEIRDRMAQFVWPIATPLTCSKTDKRGFALGTGNYARIQERTVIVTNSHVIEEAEGGHIGHLPGPSDEYVGCGPNFLTSPWPIDLGIAEIGGIGPSSERGVLREDQLCERFSPVDGELLFFLGFPGSTAQRHEAVTELNTRYSWFGQLQTVGIPMLTTVANVGANDLPHFDPEKHHAVHFPSKAKKHLDGPEEDIPNPKGMSGSLLWDTRYLACKLAGEEWSPDRARVCGLVWAAHQKPEVIVATAIEHVVPELMGMVGELARLEQ